VFEPLLLSVALLTLAACQARPVESQSRTMEGPRLDHGVGDAGTDAAHTERHAERGMYGGPRAGPIMSRFRSSTSGQTGALATPKSG
jgi:hypothetical protein